MKLTPRQANTLMRLMPKKESLNWVYYTDNTLCSDAFAEPEIVYGAQADDALLRVLAQARKEGIGYDALINAGMLLVIPVKTKPSAYAAFDDTFPMRHHYATTHEGISKKTHTVAIRLEGDHLLEASQQLLNDSWWKGELILDVAKLEQLASTHRQSSISR